MRFAFSPKRIVLVLILVATAELVLMPSCAFAMVGDVPSMPQVEQTNQGTSGGNTSGGTSSSSPGGTSGSTSTGSGSPATTPEPSALLSGLLGLGLLCAYEAICRGVS